MNISIYKKILLAALATYFIAYSIILVEDIQPLASYGDVIELLGIILALISFVVGISAHNADHRPPWICFFLTAFCSFVGEGLYSYYEHVCNITLESPSISDVFYVLYTVFCIIGLALFLKRSKSISLAGFSADFVITLIASAGLIYIFLIFPVLEDASKSFDTLILEISYPVFDFGILFGCMVIFFNLNRRGYFRNSFLLMIIGFTIVFIADQINLLAEINDLNIIKFVEPLWPLSYSFLGISCIVSAEEIASQKLRRITVSTSRAKIIEVVRMLVPYAITFASLIFVFFHYKLYNFVFMWAMFLVLMLSVRQIFVLMSNKRLTRELRKLSLKPTLDSQLDFLTLLANRSHVENVLREYQEDPDEEAFGLLFIDIDRLQTINESYGREAGDKALRGVAQAIRTSTRDTDLGGRYEEDEFIVILPGADELALSAVVGRIENMVASDPDLKALHLTLSIGAASMTLDGEMNDLLASAGLALDEAKKKGGGRLVIAGHSEPLPVEE